MSPDFLIKVIVFLLGTLAGHQFEDLSLLQRNQNECNPKTIRSQGSQEAGM